MSIDVTMVFDRAIIQLDIDPPEAVVVSGTAGRGDTFEQEGSFRKYANGATRLVLGTSSARTLPVTFRALDPDQVTTLQGLIGKTCLFRDTYGRRVWCSFLSTSTVDIPLSGLANDTLMTDITVTVEAVDHTEEV